MKNLFCLCLAMLAFVSCRKAEPVPGTAVLTGNIEDAYQRVFIGGAIVRLSDSSFTTRTDASGNFRLDSIPAGTYDLFFEPRDHQHLVIQGIEIADSQRYEISVDLREDWIVLEKEFVLHTDLAAQKRNWTLPFGQVDLKSQSTSAPSPPTTFLKRSGGGGGLFGWDIGIGIGLGSLSGAGAGGGLSGALKGASAGVSTYQFRRMYPELWRPPTANMQYDAYDPHAFVSTDKDSQSTFGADVSTASYTLTRSHLFDYETVPPASAIRIEEFLNYFDVDYPDPKAEPFWINSFGGPSPITDGYELLQIGIHAGSLDSAVRKPMDLTYVIDVSGSMDKGARLYLAVESLTLLTEQLKPGDRVGIVSYGNGAKVVLDHTGDFKKAVEAMKTLEAGGYTNAEAGLTEGYKLATKQLNPKAVSALILFTDGVANKGQTAPAGLLKKIAAYRKQGITLSACGVGMGTYNDASMEKIATNGDGQYFYIDRIEEARRVFVDGLIRTLQPVAKDVKIQVNFDPKAVREYRLIGYEKRDLPDDVFTDTKTDGGEMGQGQAITALYEIKRADSSRASIGNIVIRYKGLDGVDGSVQKTLISSAPAAGVEAETFDFLSAVALYGEIMRKSPSGSKRSLSDVRAILRKSTTEFRKNFSQYLEFAEIVYKTMEKTHQLTTIFE